MLNIFTTGLQFLWIVHAIIHSNQSPSYKHGTTNAGGKAPQTNAHQDVLLENVVKPVA